ncbi:ADP-ribosylglycohydrolase family protein [Nonomuraea sp. NPDC046570]|uniref:ADP-ribosylglycohydrolase family protein n=1 Tax=Nonomuraea sp. NPDC046570 TaxID=3155255 RepID=UPI0033C33F81
MTFRGCLLGGAIGDALGAPIEFQSMREIRMHHGPTGVEGYIHDWRGRLGLITDDTQMTLFTVEGLLHGLDPEPVRQAYLRWLDTQEHTAPPPADLPHRTGTLRHESWLYSRRAPGNTCLSGLRRDFPGPAAGGQPGPVNPGSKGCGTVMRSAPFGLAVADPKAAFDLAAACAQITHGHPTGYLAAGAFAAIIRYLADGDPVAVAVQQARELLATYQGHEETAEALRRAVELAGPGGPAPTPELIESMGGAWVAEEALAIGVYCALAEPSFEAALLLAVNHSGDSDSTGAVCGNILGLVHGEAGLPRTWVRELEGRETIIRLADELARYA